MSVSTKYQGLWILILLFLSSCVEAEILHSFRSDGSGTVEIKVAPSDATDDSPDSYEDCVEAFTEENPNLWDEIGFLEAGTPGNPNSNDTCVLGKRFDSLGEAEDFYTDSDLLDIQSLYIDNRFFYFKAYDSDCVSEPSEDETGTLLFTLELPGRITSHNADKVIGKQLTWDLLRIGCSSILAESVLEVPITRPPEEAPTPLPSTTSAGTQQDNSSPVSVPVETSSEEEENQILLWTTIGASVATIIGTVIAYTESRKKK